MSVFDNLVPRFKVENDVKLYLNTSVTLSPKMDKRCRHKQNPPLFYLVGLHPYSAPSGRAHPKINCVICFCDMKHICDLTV